MFVYIIIKEQMFKAKGESRSMFRRYKIISAPRFIAFITICTLLVIFAVTAIIGLNNAEGLSEPEYRSIEVCSGDTLWQIASEYGPKDTDLRKTVYMICSLNDIKADEIREGDILLVPTHI